MYDGILFEGIGILLKDVAPHPATKGFVLSKFRLLIDFSFGRQIGCTSAIGLQPFENKS